MKTRRNANILRKTHHKPFQSHCLELNSRVFIVRSLIKLEDHLSWQPASILFFELIVSATPHRKNNKKVQKKTHFIGLQTRSEHYIKNRVTFNMSGRAGVYVFVHILYAYIGQLLNSLPSLETASGKMNILSMF